jgi:hypothetical protein
MDRIKLTPRFVVHDENGAVRAFYTSASAKRFMKGDRTLRLVIQPKFDLKAWLNTLPPAPF